MKDFILSDARVKTVNGPYTAGLAQINAINPVEYSLNEISASKLAAEGNTNIGVIAQEIETVMPETVHQITGLVDNQVVNDLRVFDAGPLIFALINAVKELSAEITALKAQP